MRVRLHLGLAGQNRRSIWLSPAAKLFDAVGSTVADGADDRHRAFGQEASGDVQLRAAASGPALYMEPCRSGSASSLAARRSPTAARACCCPSRAISRSTTSRPMTFGSTCSSPPIATRPAPKKGEASYHTIRVGDTVVEAGAWYYPEPLEGAEPLKDLIAFYFDRMDHWYEEDEEVFVHPRDPYHRIDVIPTCAPPADLARRRAAGRERAGDGAVRVQPADPLVPPARGRVAELEPTRHGHALPVQGQGELLRGAPRRRGPRQGPDLVLRRSAARGRSDRRPALLLQRAGRRRGRRRARRAARDRLDARRQVAGGRTARS